MTLDKIEQRHELINDMIDEAFEFADMAKDFEDDNDLAAAKITLDYLIAAERLICAEEIFMDTFYRMSNTRYPNRDEQEELLTIFLVDGVYAFSNEVLLRNLAYTFKVLDEWGLRSEDGIEFKKYICDNLKALIQKYNSLYNL